MTDLRTQLYNERHNLSTEIETLKDRLKLVEVLIGLDSLFQGAWGLDNLEALGGGLEQIRNAFVFLTNLLDARPT